MRTMRYGVAALLGLGFVFTAPASADAIAEAGRSLMENYRDAVVTVRVVSNQQISYPGQGTQESEQTIEATGTIITPTGLTVLALSKVEPSSVLELMGVMNDVSIESELSDIQILRTDGSEVDAQVLLRDRDFDLVFIAPSDAVEDWSHVNLAVAANPGLLDPVIAINRLGRVAGRTHSAASGRIEAVVERPRTLYIPSRGDGTGERGSPVFTLDGDLVGILVMRAVRSTGRDNMSDNMIPIVLPAVDVLDAARQAPGYEDDFEESNNDD